MNASTRMLSPLAIVAALSGCAVPIVSRVDEGSGPLEGVQYFLTASEITATVSVRLESCSPARLLILKPTLAAAAVADDSSTFYITPRDAWNLFRAVDVAEVTLTPDHRLGTASAQVTDKTVEVLGELIDNVASLMSGALENVQIKNLIDTHKKIIDAEPAGRCTTAAHKLVKARKEAESILALLKARRTALLSTAAVSQGFGDTVTALDAAIKAQQDAVNDFKTKLTKSAQITVTPKFDAPELSPATEPAAVAVIDLLHGWFGSRTPDSACTRTSSSVDDCLVASLKLVAPGAVCTRADKAECNDTQRSEKYRAYTDKARAQKAAFASPSYSGLVYRIPESTGATLVVGRNGGNAAIEIGLESGDPAQQASFKMPASLPVGKAQEFKLGPPVPVPQWGRIAGVPSDVGYLTSNSVKVSFDDWGVPKGVAYSATPATIPALIGLVKHADAAFHPKAPPDDPAAASRGALLQQLLKYCLDAPADAVPSYCAGLTK